MQFSSGLYGTVVRNVLPELVRNEVIAQPRYSEALSA